MLNRIFLSADIEGTCGIAHWDETELDKPDYEPFRRQMTREVAAAFPRQRLHVRRIDLPRPAAQRHAHDLQHAEIHIRNVHLRIFLITPRTMFFSLSSIASRYSPTAYTAAYGTANVTTPA